MQVGRALSESLLGGSGIPALVRLSTDSPEAYDLYLRGISERDRFSYGGLQASENLLKGALATDPDFLDAKTALAVNYMHQFQTGLLSRDEAMAQCDAMTEQVLSVRPDDPLANALRLFGEIVSNEGESNPRRFFEIVEQLETLVERNPSEFQIRVLLAKLLKGVQQLDRALALLEEGAERDPFNPRVHFELGTLLLIMERPEDARAALERSLEIEPRQPNAYARLAEAGRQLGESVDVVQHLLKAFEVDPRDPSCQAGSRCISMTSG